MSRERPASDWVLSEAHVVAAKIQEERRLGQQRAQEIATAQAIETTAWAIANQAAQISRAARAQALAASDVRRNLELS